MLEKKMSVSIMNDETFFRQKILIVDDELIVRQILKKRLSDLGYQVIMAKNGNEAINFFLLKNRT
jgi:CheY-like chemotaxis protein